MTETKTAKLKDNMPQTEDLIKFAEDFVEDLDKHMADDGKIDGYELGMTFLENIPGALASWSGAGAIPDEVKAMSEQAKDEALERLLNVVKSIAGLVEKRNK